jgi:hypothetical protein
MIVTRDIGKGRQRRVGTMGRGREASAKEKTTPKRQREVPTDVEKRG